MKKISFTVILLLFTVLVNGQVFKEISIQEYLELVRKNNLEYAAQRLSLDIAEAELLSASVFNNPEIGFGYYNNEIHRMHMGTGAVWELKQVFTPGRRSVAIKIAHTHKEITHALLIDFYRVLREKATLKWLEAVKNQEIIEARKKSYKEQIEMIHTDSLSRGSEIVNDLDALQNRVETYNFYRSIAEAESEQYMLLVELTEYCGISGADTLITPERKNIWSNHIYDLQGLIDEALLNRWDLIAATKELDRSKLEVVASKREKIPEFEAFIGYGCNSEVTNEMAPSPKHNGFEFGISIPIPLFDKKRGEILKAATMQKEADKRLKQAELTVKNEVVASYYAYINANKKLKLYSSAGITKYSKELLDKKKEEYYNGEIHLLEVLDARRVYDEIIESMYSAIYDKSMALVVLQSAVGIWDILYKLPASAGTASAEASTSEPPESSASATPASAVTTAKTAGTSSAPR